MLGPAVGAEAALAGLRVDVEAELGGDDHLAADRLQRLADQFLVGEGTVGLGGVEQGDAAVVGGMDELDHLLLVGGRAVHGGHAHAAQAEGGDFQVVSEFAGFHAVCSIRCR